MNLKENLYVLGTTIIAAGIANPVDAQNNPRPNPTGLYDTIRGTILDNVANISSFVLIPIGVLMMVINLILVLWSLISGEKGQIGSRIGAIIAGFILVMIGIGISSQRETIFGQ
jgi:hypothetical protein